MPVVQYVIIRADLTSVLKWPIGALIAQACHACTAVIHSFYDDMHTKEYLGDIHRMHKVILSVSIYRRECVCNFYNTK